MLLMLRIMTWGGVALMGVSLVLWVVAFFGLERLFVVSLGIVLLGMVLILVAVLIERLRNKEDSHYSKNVKE